MSILDLPIELLEEIFGFLGGRNYENAALSCRALCDASDKYLKDHNALRKLYRRFEYSKHTRRGHYKATGDELIRSSLELILRIAKRPIIADYVEYADFRNDTSEDAEKLGVRTLQEEEERASAGQACVKTVVQKSLYLLQAGADTDDWYERILRNYKTATWPLSASLLLLTLLPNLKELYPPSEWKAFPTIQPVSHSQQLWKVMDLIPAKATSGDAGAALSRLETIYPFTGTGYDTRVALQTLAPVLSIPSVRSFYAASCIANDDSYTGKKFETRYPSFGANLERVEMAGCCIDPEHIAKFLRCTPKLKIFKFSFETKWHGCGHYWDAGHFVDAVQKEAGEQLEELTITVANCYGGTGTGVVSLKGFKNVKEIEISTDILLGPPLGGEIDRAWYPEVCIKDNKCFKCTGETPTGPADVPKLIDLLPSSVERVFLVLEQKDEDVECFMRLFRDFDASEIEKKFPNMKLCSMKVGQEGRTDLKNKKLSIRDERWAPVRDAINALGWKGECVETEGSLLPTFQEIMRNRGWLTDVEELER